MAQVYVFEYGVGGVPASINLELLSLQLSKSFIVYGPSDFSPPSVKFLRLEEGWDANGNPAISIRGIPGDSDPSRFSIFWTEDIENGPLGVLAEAEQDNIVFSHDPNEIVESVETITSSGLIKDYFWGSTQLYVLSDTPITLTLPPPNEVPEGAELKIRNQGKGSVTLVRSSGTLAESLDPCFLSTGGSVRFVNQQLRNNFIVETSGLSSSGSSSGNGALSPNGLQWQNLSLSQIGLNGVLYSTNQTGESWNLSGALGSDTQTLTNPGNAFDWSSLDTILGNVFVGLVPKVLTSGADPATFLDGSTGSLSRSKGFIFWAWLNPSGMIEVDTTLLQGGVELVADKQTWKSAMVEGLRLMISSNGFGEFRKITNDVLLAKTTNVLPPGDYRIGIKLVNPNSQISSPLWVENGIRGTTGVEDSSSGASSPYVPTTQISFDGVTIVTFPQDVNNEEVLRWGPGDSWEIDFLLLSELRNGVRVTLLNNGGNSIGMARFDKNHTFYIDGNRNYSHEHEESILPGSRVSVSFDGSICKWYVEGEEVYTFNNIPVSTNPSTSFTMGASQNSFLGPLFGDVAELRMYNRVLTEEERKSAVANPNPASIDVTPNFFSNSVVGYWPFYGPSNVVTGVVGNDGSLNNEWSRGKIGDVL